MTPRITFNFMLVIITLMCGMLIAQPVTGLSPINDDPTIEQLEARIVELGTLTSLDEAAKAATIEIYRNAIEQLRLGNKFSLQTREFKALSDSAPQLLATIRAELAVPPTEPNPVVPVGANLTQVEQLLNQANADLQAARQQSADLQTETTKRNERRTLLTDQIARTRQILADFDGSSTTVARESDSSLLIDARRVLLRAQNLALIREVESQEAELASYDARRDLLPARRDRAQRRVSDAEKLVSAWQAIVTKQRLAEAETAAADARRLRREAARQHPVLKKFADETSMRASARTGPNGTTEQIDATSKSIQEVNNQLSSIQAQFRSVKRRLEVSGLNRATGLLLRHQYDALPEISTIDKRLEKITNLREDTDYKRIGYEEDRVDAGDIDRVAQELLSQIPVTDPSVDRTELELVARELAAARRDLLDQEIAESSTYFNNLDALQTSLQEYLSVVETYRLYIEERILWVRSISGDRTSFLSDLNDGQEWIGDAHSWNKAWTLTIAYLKAHLAWTIVGAILLAILWVLGVGSSSKQRLINDQVARFSTDSFRLTIRAYLLTVVSSTPGATTLYTLGWVLRQPDDQVPIAMALSTGLMNAGVILSPLSFLRHMLRSCGLADAHFRWRVATMKPIRRNLRWFIPIVVPSVLLVSMIDQSDNEGINALFGRTFFTIELLALAFFLHRVLRPRGQVLNRFIEEHKNGWVYRLRFIWHPIAVLPPLVFIALSWLGFHYTALQLQSRLEQSLALALVLVVANGLMMRWLFIARRRVAVDDARRRRAQQAAATEAASKASAGEAAQDPIQPIDADKVDLPSISSQTKQIFGAAISVAVVVGLFMIWAEAMPALRMLDRVQVWPSVRVIDPVAETVLNLSSTNSSQSTTPSSGDSNGQSGINSLTPTPTMMTSGGDDSTDLSPLTITVSDIGMSLVILIATWIAFRNIPGLIEIIVLQRLPLDAGSRYALSTVMRYLIAIIGVIIAFNTLGISWSKVQWLAAALTFGLAFGLQEIFANFVSGLIILAERPIRLGDTITVGGVTGTVTRIRMRATTIGDWDRKELVIPNKTFITGDVINWSLSDPILRVKIPVGVSYSSDVDQVTSVLMSAAEKHAVVLKDPKPQVVFKEFGDSTLNFELRVFIPKIDYLVPVRHELHIAIFKAFAQAGIEIAFPQRDLHVRSIGDLSKLVERREDLTEAEKPK